MTLAQLIARYEAITLELTEAGVTWDYTTVINRLSAETGRTFAALEEDLAAYFDGEISQ